MTTTSIKRILAVSSFLIMSTMTSTTSALLSSKGSPLITICTTCSTLVGQVLVGLGSTTNSPTAYTAILAIASGDLYCKNKANNAISSGQPFQGVAFIQGADAVNFQAVSRNGRFLADLVFEDEDLIAAINLVIEPDISCQNANWIPIVIIKSMEVLGQEVVDPNPAPGQTSCSLAPGEPLVIDESCDVTDNLRTSCVLPSPYFNNTKLVLQQGTVDYVCTQICHDSLEANCNLTTP